MRIDSDETETRARMNLSPEVDDYIKDAIDHSLGLPISIESLQKKLLAAEEAQRRLRDQYLALLSRSKEKDQVLDRVRVSNSFWVFLIWFVVDCNLTKDLIFFSSDQFSRKRV